MTYIQQGDAQKRLKKAFGIEGGSPAPSLAPEIVPVVITKDLSVGDPYATSDDIPYVASATQSAVAGEYSYLGIGNPATSGVVATIHSCQVANQTGAGYQNFGYLVGEGLPTAVPNAMERMIIGEPDDQVPPTAVNIQVDHLVSGAQLTKIFELYVPTTADFFPLGITLFPGWFFGMRSSAVNQQIRGTWFVTTNPFIR